MQNLNKTRIVTILRIIMPMVAVASVWLFAPWEAAILWLTPLSDDVQAELDRAVAYGLDGIIVYIDQPDAEPALYAAGWHDRDAQIPADPQALFKIGSISKLYMATAAAKLVHNGDLSLDDTLADHLPDLIGQIDHAEQITVRMMLQHRSGLPDFVEHPDYPWFETLPNNDAYLTFALDMPAEFEPDARYDYSNTNYLLLGEIFDNVLGYSHHDYIHDEIVAPLGLTETYSLMSDVESIERISSGYFHDIEADLRPIDHRAPNGSMIATAHDVGVFLRALNDGTLLTPEEQAIYDDIYIYEHTGWVAGYHSIARKDAQSGAVIVQFVNTTGNDIELTTSTVFNRIARTTRR